ncbi:hypothetical protein E3N88_38571 [Mikania micrantha]|uniref:Uncharacterized protein n=1 Tax=Mikania micrantha TaxID=192012 RepID=A0A5N6LUD3_9ASTR|nr:hypothetical protein E3N88_38571 [Mikania micrantha]
MEEEWKSKMVIERGGRSEIGNIHQKPSSVTTKRRRSPQSITDLVALPSAGNISLRQQKHITTRLQLFDRFDGCPLHVLFLVSNYLMFAFPQQDVAEEMIMKCVGVFVFRASVSTASVPTASVLYFRLFRPTPTTRSHNSRRSLQQCECDRELSRKF